MANDSGERTNNSRSLLSRAGGPIFKWQAAMSVDRKRPRAACAKRRAAVSAEMVWRRITSSLDRPQQPSLIRVDMASPFFTDPVFRYADRDQNRAL